MGERVGGGVEREAGVSRCKLSHIGWINNKVLLYRSGPQPFWHQGLVSWKTIFPWTSVGTGDGSGGNASDGERWEAADEASLACPLVTAHLLLCGAVPNRSRTRIGLRPRD